MKINVFYWEKLDEKQKADLLVRAEADISGLRESVQKILTAVKEEGDRALIRFTRDFDGADLEETGLRVSKKEIAEAVAQIPEKVKKAIRFSMENIQRFHDDQKAGPMSLSEIRPGVHAGERFTPIPSVGLYVPHGRGSFPSVMYMLAVPARIAAVPRVVVVTPPDREGRVDPATLYTARLCGVEEIYRVGGAPADRLPGAFRPAVKDSERRRNPPGPELGLLPGQLFGRTG